jgi:hypothetical protein
MNGKPPTLVLLCALALAPVAHGLADDARGPRELMADVMVRMMETMGMFGGALGAGKDGTPPWPTLPGMTPFGVMGMPGVSPMGMPVQDPSKAIGMGTEMMKQFSQGATGLAGATAAGDGVIDGVWQGSGGDVLIAQDGRYRIYAPQDQYVDGWFQLQPNRIALYNAQDGHTQIFEYATHEGRLALRGSDGQVFLYRRFGDLSPTGAQAAVRPAPVAPPVSAPSYPVAPVPSYPVAPAPPPAATTPRTTSPR